MKVEILITSLKYANVIGNEERRKAYKVDRRRDKLS